MLIKKVQQALSSSSKLEDEPHYLLAVGVFLDYNANLKARVGSTTADAVVRQLAASRHMDHYEPERRDLEAKFTEALKRSKGGSMSSCFGRTRP